MPASGMTIFDKTLSPGLAEARLLHPQDHGFFTVAALGSNGKWKQDHFHTSTLDTVAAALKGNSDTYISQASFVSKLRRSSNMKAVRSVYVDLDIYNVPGLDNQQVAAEKVEERARELGIPAPSYIASSGRGLYAKWVFDSPINAGLLPSWKLMQRKLVSAYLPIGADPKVIDPARVLRLQETINSKNGGEVRVLKERETYSFYDLIHHTEHLEILKQKEGKIVKAKAKAFVNQNGRRIRSTDKFPDEALTDLEGLKLYSSLHEPVMLQKGRLSLNWSRFLDLRDLVIRRGGIARGSRDLILFWMVSFLAQAKIINPENFWSEVQALLASFPVGRDFNPMHDGSLTTLYERLKSQAKGEKVNFGGLHYLPVYTPSNDTLINMLEISADEEAGLRTIISSTEKSKRADATVPGRAERRVERIESREVAVNLKSKGLTDSEIARTLKKDRSTIGRWLTPAPDAGKSFIETRGRRRRTSHTNYTRTRVRLTGRGPVIETIIIGRGVDPLQPAHPPGSPGSPRPLTEQEIQARTKIRQQKSHLCESRAAWSSSQIRSWLDERRLCIQRRSNERAACANQANAESISAQADQLVAELIEQLRRSSKQATEHISISGCGSLSSNPNTGPPA
jgi:hypothetical protein